MQAQMERRKSYKRQYCCFKNNLIHVICFYSRSRPRSWIAILTSEFRPKSHSTRSEVRCKASSLFVIKITYQSSAVVRCNHNAGKYDSQPSVQVHYFRRWMQRTLARVTYRPEFGECADSPLRR